MARIRTIKPAFWEDEKIAKLPMNCRLFYIGTWNLADDLGVIRANPALLKSSIFPYDENLRVSEVQKWIDALVDARMLIPISYKDESYYVVRTFRSHQKLDPRYPNYIIPQEVTIRILEDCDRSSEVTLGTQRVPTEHPLRDGDLYGDLYGENNISRFSSKEEKTVNFSFSEFWNLYDKKVGRKDLLEKKWLKLSDKDREKAMKYIPRYKEVTPDKQFRKNPESFLNQKSWNDELITGVNSGKSNFVNHDNTKHYDDF